MNNIEFKEIRKKLNLSQNELAEKLGFSRKTISQYENSEEIPEHISLLMNYMLTEIKENNSYTSETQLHILREESKVYSSPIEKVMFETLLDKLEPKFKEIEKRLTKLEGKNL